MFFYKNWVACRLFVFFVILVGCSLPSPTPTVLAKVEDAKAFKRGDWIEFTGVSVTTVMGEHRWRHRGGNAYQPNPNNPHPQAMWVVPVINPGDSAPKDVHMWVAAPHEWTRHYQKPGPWFAKLKADFDGKLIQKNLLGSAGGPSTWTSASPSWEKAIKDVITRTGLTTPPDAAVVLWPPKGELPPNP